jgi:MFS family permease
MALQVTSFVMILPLFARRFSELGAGVEALGVSAMAYALTSALAAPFMGALADRIGRRRIVLVSLAAYALAFTGYLAAPSAAVFILVRGLAGIFTAGLNPAITGLAADLAPKDRRAQWIGYITSGASFGWIAGPIAGGVIFDHWGYNSALAIAIVTAAAAFGLAYLAVPASAKTGAGNSAAAGKRLSLVGYLHSLRGSLPSSLPAFAVLLFITFAVLFAWAFIEPRATFYAYNELGWSSSRLGLVMSTYGIAMTLGELLLGQISDRVGRKPVILVGLALFSAQFLGLAFFENYLLIAISFTIAGLGNALFDPALVASILDISPEQHRARILGVRSMFGSLGSILGPALVALLNASLNARSIFLVSVGVVLFTSVVALADLASVKAATSVSEPPAGRNPSKASTI